MLPGHGLGYEHGVGHGHGLVITVYKSGSCLYVMGTLDTNIQEYGSYAVTIIYCEVPLRT